MTDEQYLEWLRSPEGGYMLVVPAGEGQWAGVLRLMFHWTIHIGLTSDRSGCHQRRFCYATAGLALDALAEWAGRSFEGEPIYWHRDPYTGRRRPDGDASREYVEG